MLVSSINSGLGNQMFQYACGRAIAATRGYEFAIDGSTLEGDSQRDFELPKLFDTAKFVRTVPQLKRKARANLGWMTSLRNRRDAKDAFGFRRYVEPAFHFDAGVFDVDDDTMLLGYWQSERYFHRHRDLIRSDFSFVTKPNARNAAMLAEVSEGPSVSLHVRRGDYVVHPIVAQMHGTCTPDYYERALEHIGRRVPAFRLFVFSDDPDWVKANMTFPVTPTIVSWNRGADSFEDLRLMSNCKHNIIANSSFSWWAAYLNGNPGKQVVAPAKWFGTAEHDTRDLIPDAWTRL